MTEQWLRDLAERYGLTIEKRITTGNEKAHFATFELTGLRERLHLVYPIIRQQDRGLDFDGIRCSDNGGELYIFCESVWCEVPDATAVS